MKPISLILFVLLLTVVVGCDKPGEIRIRNSVTGATLQNVRWGDVMVAAQLYPGEASTIVNIYDEPDWGVDLPADEPIRFYLNVGGDLIYLETRESYHLDEEVKLTVEIHDTTKVWNSVVND